MRCPDDGQHVSAPLDSSLQHSSAGRLVIDGCMIHSYQMLERTSMPHLPPWSSLYQHSSAEILAITTSMLLLTKKVLTTNMSLWPKMFLSYGKRL